MPDQRAGGSPEVTDGRGAGERRKTLQFFLYETRPTWLADDGTLSYEELAKAFLEWLTAIPLEERMAATGMERGPCKFCGADADGPDGDDEGCDDGPHSFGWHADV